MDCPLCKDNKVVATDSKDKAGFEFRCLECDHRWSNQKPLINKPKALKLGITITQAGKIKERSKGDRNK